jgi:hypothetical protein
MDSTCSILQPFKGFLPGRLSIGSKGAEGGKDLYWTITPFMVQIYEKKQVKATVQAKNALNALQIQIAFRALHFDYDSIC